MSNLARYPRLAASLYGVPLMIHPDKLSVIEAVFRNYIGGSGNITVDADVTKVNTATSSAGGRTAGKNYFLSDGGIAVIPVMGTMVQRADSLDAMSGLTSYSSINRLMSSAVDDPDVRGILLEFDTPGGEVNGLFDFADEIKAISKVKPVWGISNEAAYSAGYAMACACDKLYMPRTAGVGSIGVVAMHVDQSKRDSAQGYSFTPIFAGAKKIDGNSHAPLSDTAMSDLQNRVDQLYGMFVQTVAKNRGIDEKAVRDTEAGLLFAEEAVSKGYVDGIATLAQTITMMEKKVKPKTQGPSGLPFSMKGNNMSQDEQQQQNQEAIRAAAHAEGVKAGAKSERDRINKILGSASAEGRETLAKTMALESDIDPDTAIKLLESSPKTQAAAAQTGAKATSEFSQAMAAIGNPNIGAAADTSAQADLTEEQKGQALIAQILNAGKPKA